MLLTEYLSAIVRDIDEYAKTGLILSSEIFIDSRTEKIGLVKGNITFLDESKLYYTEYLDLRYNKDKLSYSFHYQDKDNKLIFRYDNASHKPKLDYKDHKHVGQDIYEAEVPELKDVLEEIISCLLKLRNRKNGGL